MNYDIERQHCAALNEVNALAGKMDPQERIKELEKENAALWRHLRSFVINLDDCKLCRNDHFSTQYVHDPLVEDLPDKDYIVLIPEKLLEKYFPGEADVLDEDALRKRLMKD